MKSNFVKIFFITLVLFTTFTYGQKGSTSPGYEIKNKYGYINASDYGFSPNASGIENVKALQKAVDLTGTIIVSQPGTYNMAGTVYIGSYTSLKFGNNIFLKKVNEQGVFTHVFLNKGALTKTYDQNITIEGLNIIVNGIDKGWNEVYGLRGQIAFFYIKDLRIDRFRCLDLATNQFCVHICTFEDIIINDVIIKGNKDGIHLGRGKRFTISNCVFQTYDDAIALNGQDYVTSNPEMGWIEDGVIENCHDLADARKPAAYFCRMLAGAWIDWKPGMEVHHSDAVVSNGKIYRVQAKPDGKIYKSVTQPTFEKGNMVLDSINWGMVQSEAVYTAGVRNVIIRNIFLEKARTGISVHFDIGNYSRSYYPGAVTPKQEQFTFDNIRVLYDNPTDIISVGTPIDVITITNSSFRNNRINVHGSKSIPDYLKTKINITGCVFNQNGKMELINNSVDNKEILLKTSSNIEINDDFSAFVTQGKGKIIVESDLTGLKK